MKKVINIRIILTLFVFLSVWAFWMFVYPAHLYMHEQLQLFEYTWGYFLDTISKPAGFAEYLSRFLIQFFYDGRIGPVIVAVLFALLYNATVLLGNKSDKPKTSTAMTIVVRYILPVVTVLLLTAFLMGIDAKLTLPVGMCISLYAVWLTERFSSWRVSLPLTIVVSVLLAFACGSVFVVYTFLAFGRSAVRSLSDNWKIAVAYLIIALVTWTGIVLLLSVVYPYPLGVLTWGDYYNRFVFVKAEYNVLTWWVIIALGIFLACDYARWYGLLAPIATIVCGYFTWQQYVPDEESLLDNIRLVRMNQWDDILAKYQRRTPASSYELTGLNLALAMKGQLADRYFHYPQKGTEGLLPVYKMDYMTPLLSAEAYYQMGMINTSQRFFYESMESIADHQKSAYCLQRLVMTALANGRINLAKGYLYKLRNTCYYKEWAENMQKYVNDPKLIDNNPELKQLRKLRTPQDSFFDDVNQPPFIAEMLNYNPDNHVAWQYLFTMLMAEGRLDELMQTAMFYSKHFPQAFFPVHVQEALLYTWVTRNNTLNGFPWRVQTAIGQRFLDFAKQANQPREVAEPIVRRNYGDTFWCYAVFKAQEVQAKSEAVDGMSSASAQAPRE